MNLPWAVIDFDVELVASIKVTGIIINDLCRIRLRNFVIAFSWMIRVIVKYIGKALLETGF